MKQLDFSKGIIKESKQEPEVVNEFLGTLLVCSVLGVVGSTAVLNVFKNISSLRTELVKLRNDRMQAKASKMKAKLEREQSKRQYYLTKAGFSEDEIKKIMSGDNGKDNDKDNDKERDNNIKELRGLLKKKPDDLSPRERKRLEELSNKVDSDDLSPKEQESLTSITGKSKGDKTDSQKWSNGYEPTTPEEKKEFEEWQKNLNDSKNKAYKSMMAYENAIKTLPDGPEKDKHLKNLDNMTAVISGAGDASQVEQLEKMSKESLPPEAQKLVDQVEKSTNKISDEDLENWKKEKGITDTGIVKTTNTVAETDPALLNPPKEKSEDDIKKEIKDKYSQEDAEVPEELQDKDKKLDPAKVDALKGDELKAAAEKAGVKTTVEEPKKEDEPKKDDEPAKKDGEGGDEPKKDEPKDDNKVPYYDTEGNETGMYVVKKEDGSYEMQNEKGEKQEGDVDEKDFEEMKKVRDEKAKKEEPKKEEPNKEEPKKDTEGEEDDPKKDDERTDNDDDLDDPEFTTKDGKATYDEKGKDPRKLWKKRTYKRGDKTFTTKSYYNKHGVSISADEFKERMQAYEKKNKKKNESFTSHPWSVTRLCETKKPAPVMEAEQGSDMESICKERLVYIKFVMDTTTNSVEKVKMERMYNAIYNCCFDANGKARTMEDLYTYLNETMIENKGDIPGLPTNDQVLNIDDKCKAWKKTSPDKFDAYMARLNKELLDKAGTKKSDKAKDLLSPDNTDSVTDAIEKIRKLSTKYGFTNILGLEPTRQASKEDDENKDEIAKQKKDGSPDANAEDSKDVKADDISSEQIDKITGVSK